MTGPSDDVRPEDDRARAIVEFWEVARVHAGVARLAVITGGGTGTAPPPAWSFGDNPPLADALLAAVLDGSKTATSTAEASFALEDEAMPTPGDLSILLDGSGRPRALIRTTSVETVRFEDVDAGFAAAEGEDDRTLESWRRSHETYFRRVLEGSGVAFGPDLPVVLERFEVLFPRVGRPANQ